jgi:Lipase maturation factor
MPRGAAARVVLDRERRPARRRLRPSLRPRIDARWRGAAATRWFTSACRMHDHGVVDAYFGEVWWVRVAFQRGLGCIYFVAFLSALCQFRALIGEAGLAPIPNFLARVSFREAPSIFHAGYSDRRFACVAWVGIVLSLCTLAGLSEMGSVWLSAAVWLVLWMLYLSIVNVGQTFYGFGWESMLCEAGFFAVFLGPAQLAPSLVPILALRWMLFRTELGAGLIKLRHDSCWRDLTCLYYHHETQPLPNPLSWYFHRLPKPVHRAGVVFSHFTQIVVPFGLFGPQPVAAFAGALIILHQLLLIVSGNYSWLNWLTVVLGITAFGDAQLGALLPLTTPATLPRALTYEVVQYALALATLVLSVQPIKNFFSRHQLMNHNYNALAIVNAYGAFGSVTRERYEVIVEGAADEEAQAWKEYQFKAKPGDPTRRPRQVAPYHLRLDWLMWFLPLGGGHERWFLRFLEKLLQGDRHVLRLLGHNPFPHEPPRWIRARLFAYRYSTRRERQDTGAWWVREPVGNYVSPLALAEQDEPDPRIGERPSRVRRVTARV